jgi:hypothetical protein
LRKYPGIWVDRLRKTMKILRIADVPEIRTQQPLEPQV